MGRRIIHPEFGRPPQNQKWGRIGIETLVSLRIFCGAERAFLFLAALLPFLHLRQVVKLDGIFAQHHARYLIRAQDGRFAVLHHAGQCNC